MGHMTAPNDTSASQGVTSPDTLSACACATSDQKPSRETTHAHTPIWSTQPLHPHDHRTCQGRVSAEDTPPSMICNPPCRRSSRPSSRCPPGVSMQRAPCLEAIWCTYGTKIAMMEEQTMTNRQGSATARQRSKERASLPYGPGTRSEESTTRIVAAKRIPDG